MSTAIDSARVGTTREIDDDYYKLLHTFDSDISFLHSLPFFHAYVFFFISLPVDTPRKEDTSEDQNSQRAHVCIKWQ